MKRVELPVNTPPFQNVDSVVLDQLGEALYDGYIDELGNTNKRSGLLSYINLGSNQAVQGLYWWTKNTEFISVSDGKVYKITNSTGTTTEITSDALETTGRPTFADNGSTLAMANGAKIVYSDNTTTTYVADADAPTTVTHVAYLDDYLLANNTGEGTIYFADFTAAPTTWLSADIFTAESNPDNVLALYVNKRTIVVMGTSTIEFWTNDGINPFSRINGTTIQNGVMASYCTVIVNGIIYFLDDKRRLTRIDGFTPTRLSTSFDKTIQGFSTVSDCIADYITPDGKNWILFTFPTESRTLFYDLDGNYWGEFSYWDGVANSRKRFLMNCYAYSPDWNQHLAGSFQIDDVFKLISTEYQDNSVDIHFSKTTGHIDHGAEGFLKTSYKAMFRMKTGVGTGAGGNTEPQMRVRWKDDGATEWSNWRYVGLNVQGKREFEIYLYNLGAYRTRQWHFELTENVPFVMGKAFEWIDINEF